MVSKVNRNVTLPDGKVVRETKTVKKGNYGTPEVSYKYHELSGKLLNLSLYKIGSLGQIEGMRGLVV